MVDMVLARREHPDSAFPRAFTTRGFIRRSESAANHCATLANGKNVDRTISSSMKRSREDGRKQVMRPGINRNALPRRKDSKPWPVKSLPCRLKRQTTTYLCKMELQPISQSAVGIEIRLYHILIILIIINYHNV